MAPHPPLREEKANAQAKAKAFASAKAEAEEAAKVRRGAVGFTVTE